MQVSARLQRGTSVAALLVVGGLFGSLLWNASQWNKAGERASVYEVHRQRRLLHQEGENALARGDYPLAERLSREEIAENPKSRGAKILLADAMLATGRFDEVRAIYRDLGDADPVILARQGELDLKAGRPESARKAYIQAIGMWNDWLKRPGLTPTDTRQAPRSLPVPSGSLEKVRAVALLAAAARIANDDAREALGYARLAEAADPTSPQVQAALAGLTSGPERRDHLLRGIAKSNPPLRTWLRHQLEKEAR